MIKELTKNSWPLFIQNDVAAKNAYKYYADILTGKKYTRTTVWEPWIVRITKKVTFSNRMNQWFQKQKSHVNENQ